MSGPVEAATPAAPGSGEALRRDRWRTGGLYAALMIGASSLGFVKLLVFAAILGPTELGYYGYVLLVLQFGIYASNWGLLNGLNVELPLAYGRGDATPEREAGRALSALAIVATTTALLYLCVVIAVGPTDSDVRTALMLAAATTLLSTLSEFYVLVMRARRRLIPLSLTYFMRAALAIALGAAAGAVWGYRGVIVSELLALVLVIAIAIRLWVPDVRPRRPRVASALGLIRIGVPLMVSNFVVAGSLAIDRVFVAAELPEEFGQYTFATIVVTGAIAITGMLNQAVAPQLLYERGRGRSLEELRGRLLRIIATVAAGGTLGFGALLVAVAVLDDGLLSEYESGLDAMPILYLGGLATVLAIYGTILLAARRFVLTMLASGLGLVVASGAGFAVALTNPTLQGFAWVFAASQIAAVAALAAAVEVVVRRERA